MMPPKNKKMLSSGEILFGTVVLPLNSVEVHYCRRQIKDSSAENHQLLALMNNIFFDPVVVSLNSAEVQPCLQKNEFC